ncbi:MAG: hypothetical protein IPH97_10355 [Ignavibacteriales bacterium]|nr:hypothetical protein [Ignavibacteriales bacterium]
MKNYQALKYFDQSEMENFFENSKPKVEPKTKNNISSKIVFTFVILAMGLSSFGLLNFINKNYVSDLSNIDENLSDEESNFCSLVLHDLMKNL